MKTLKSEKRDSTLSPGKWKCVCLVANNLRHRLKQFETWYYLRGLVTLCVPNNIEYLCSHVTV
jgi:hypothetical protein